MLNIYLLFALLDVCLYLLSCLGLRTILWTRFLACLHTTSLHQVQFRSLVPDCHSCPWLPFPLLGFLVCDGSKLGPSSYNQVPYCPDVRAGSVRSHEVDHMAASPITYTSAIRCVCCISRRIASPSANIFLSDGLQRKF